MVIGPIRVRPSSFSTSVRPFELFKPIYSWPARAWCNVTTGPWSENCKFLERKDHRKTPGNEAYSPRKSTWTSDINISGTFMSSRNIGRRGLPRWIYPGRRNGKINCAKYQKVFRLWWKQPELELSKARSPDLTFKTCKEIRESCSSTNMITLDNEEVEGVSKNS